MNNIELKNKLVDLVNNHATVYGYGCWGNKLTESLINAKAKQYSWWYTSSKKAQLLKMTKLGYVVWAFDCVNMIKGILWGWNGDCSKSNGGAVYASNNVPDVSANEMINLCKNVTSNFNSIEIGEAVWMNGHIGIYIGNGEVIECTPAWKNKVQITKLSQRKWLKHGKLPYITYQTNQNPANTSEPFLSKKGYLKKGDSGQNIEKICKFMHDTFSNYGKWLKLDNEKILGNYFGPILDSYIKEFQKRAKAEKKYNDAIDGCIGPKTLAALKYYGFKE